MSRENSIYDDESASLSAYLPSSLLSYQLRGRSVSMSSTTAPGTESAYEAITRTWEDTSNQQHTYHAWNYPENMQNTQDQPRPPITPETINQSVEFMKRLNAAANNSLGLELLKENEAKQLFENVGKMTEALGQPNASELQETPRFKVDYADFCAMQHKVVARYHRAHMDYFEKNGGVESEMYKIAKKNMEVAENDARINQAIAGHWEEIAKKLTQPAVPKDVADRAAQVAEPAAAKLRPLPPTRPAPVHNPDVDSIPAEFTFVKTRGKKNGPTVSLGDLTVSSTSDDGSESATSSSRSSRVACEIVDRMIERTSSMTSLSPGATPPIPGKRPVSHSRRQGSQGSQGLQ